MKKFMIRIICGFSALAVIMLSACSNGSSTGQSSALQKNKETVSITVWNYYNGNKKIAFDEMAEEFNNTVGMEKGIAVSVASQSGIGGLVEELMKSINGKVGAEPIPDIAQVYPETAYNLYEMEKLVELDSYFTAEELDEYVPSFLEEGRLVENGPIVNFPINKSFEVFAYNKTDWDKFKNATGVDESMLGTIEDVIEVSEKYYEWTDSLTPDIKEDGKAFFGRYSMDNYMVIGAKQLGKPIFSIENGEGVVTLDKDVMKTLWSNFYVPFLNGYFTSKGNYSADDAKVGEILALVGSTSGVSYFPDKVTISDNENYQIESVMTPAPMFKDFVSPAAVQQGAGYSVINNSEETVEASVEFLKWITMEEQNIEFSISTGYIPVKKSACDKDKITTAYKNVYGDENKKLLDALLVGVDVINQYEPFSGKPFEGTEKGRNVLKNCMKQMAIDDRAKVVELISQGQSRESAVAQFTTEQNFENWYEQLKTDIESVINP